MSNDEDNVAKDYDAGDGEKPHRPWIESYPDGFDWNDEVQACPVYDILKNTREKYGDRPAFDFMGKKWSWGQIGSEVDRFARGLQNLGIGQGIKVGLFLPNTPYYLIAYYALMRIGATAVNLNPLYAPREIKHLIEDSETDLIITVDLKQVYDKLDGMLEQTRLNQIIVCRFQNALPFPKNLLFRLFKGGDIAKVPDTDHHFWYEDLVDNNGNVREVEISPENDIAVLQYTGGTTGTPKGAMLSHANVSANVEQCVKWFQQSRPGEEKMVGVLPFFHVFAMTAVMNMSVRQGFEILALPRFELEDTLKLVDKHKPHYFPAVPAIYNAINNFKDLSKYDLTSLLYCISGGAPLPVEVKKKFEKVTGCVVVEGYGLSESSPVVCINPVEGENRAGSIGLPVFQTDVVILDPDDKKTPKEIGEPGELCVRGPQVMQGYWRKPEETDECLREGLLYTGDIAKMDEDGYLYVVDRIKDLIITNGYNVYPRNVEEAIYLHDDVEECIVAGIPDEARGEIVKAWVKPKEGKTLKGDALKTFLKDKISPIEIPKKIEIRDDPLPRTMIGKLSRKDILAEDNQDTGDNGDSN